MINNRNMHTVETLYSRINSITELKANTRIQRYIVSASIIELLVMKCTENNQIYKRTFYFGF